MSPSLASRLLLPLLALALVLPQALLSPGIAQAAPGLNPPPPRPYHIALQVGHYKNNELPQSLARLISSTGTSGGGRSEVSLNLDVARRVAGLLRAQGAIVDIMPATVPTGYAADAFVAIHADGNAYPSSRGFKISTRWSSRVAAQDSLLVHELDEAYASATGLPENKTVTANMRGYYAFSPWRSSYRISNFTPGAIVEMGFMTNAADRAVMFNQTDRLASGLAQGIMNFVAQSYGVPATSQGYGFGVGDRGPGNSAPALRRPKLASAGVTTGLWLLYPMSSGDVNVYAGPSSKSPIIGTLPSAQLARSEARTGGYFRVSLPDGRLGWVPGDRLVVQL